MFSLRSRVYATTWVSYASLYLARKPFSVVKAELLSQGLSRTDVGNIDTAFLAAYAGAQLVVGPYGDRLGVRCMLSTLMAATAAAAFAFACVPVRALPLAGLWLLNGALQSAAFPLCMKALSPIFGPSERGSALGWWSTCQSIGGVAGSAVAAALLSCGHGWRAAVGAPALAVGVAAGLVALALPESAAPARDWHSEPSARPASPDATPRLLTVAATHPHLLLLGGAYGLVKLVRYVALLWLPLYLHEEQALSPAAAGFLSTAFDAGGALGGGLWGMAADHRSLRGRRRDRRLAPRRPTRREETAPPSPDRRVHLSLPLCLLAGAAAALGGTCSDEGERGAGRQLLGAAADGGGGYTGRSATLLALFASGFGFVLAGPETSLCGAAVSDLVAAHPDTQGDVSATAFSLVNGIGAFGPLVQGSVAVIVVGAWGWGGLFWVLAGLCILSAAMLLPVAREEARRGGGAGLGYQAVEERSGKLSRSRPSSPGASSTSSELPSRGDESRLTLRDREPLLSAGVADAT